jgi:probable phosphoglycerate mutase
VTRIAFIRHGETDWNITGKVQGHTDVPLGATGIAEVEGWALPEEFADFAWIASPLRRAAETARLLIGDTPTDPRLQEMDWGAWEGRTIPDLRAELGPLMAAWEAEGLDFKAPRGESPRDVQARMAPFLVEIAGARRDTVAVTHRGVIRAIYAMAVGWDMKVKPADKILDGCVHLFALELDGTPRVERLNIPLTPVAA